MKLVTHDAMHETERLMRVPDAFEQCGCDGDMETLAAIYWHADRGNLKPIRWLPWDPAVAAALGDDATYEELVKAIAAKYPEGLQD